MLFEKLTTTIDKHLYVTIYDEENLRENDEEYIKLKRYKEEATEDRDVTHVEFQVEWEFRADVFGTSNNRAYVQIEPFITKVVGYVQYTDFVNTKLSQEQRDFLMDTQLDDDPMEELEQDYQMDIDTDEEGWEIEIDEWDEVKVDGMITPAELEINIQDKKILVKFYVHSEY